MRRSRPARPRSKARLGRDVDFRLRRRRRGCPSATRKSRVRWPKGITAGGSALSPLGQVYEASCWRRQQRFTVALGVARQVLASLETREASPLDHLAAGAALLESGEGRGRTAAYRERAHRLRRRQPRVRGARRHRVERQLLPAGGPDAPGRSRHLKAAGVTLDYAERAAPPGGDVALLAQLMRAELADRLKEDRRRAAAIIEQAGVGRPASGPADPGGGDLPWPASAFGRPAGSRPLRARSSRKVSGR